LSAVNTQFLAQQPPRRGYALSSLKHFLAFALHRPMVHRAKKLGSFFSPSSATGRPQPRRAL